MRSPSLRFFAAFALLCGLIGAAEVARADVDARRVAPLMMRDRGVARAWINGAGKVPVLVQLEPGETAAALGLVAVAPGFGARHVAPDKLDGFVSAQGGRGVRLAPPRRPLLDVSGIWTKAPQARNETGFDGTGVVIGVIDTGIDPFHPDFRRADGTTRIAWVIQGGTPRGVHPALEEAYGCTSASFSPCGIWSAADIDAALQTSPPGALPVDHDGHGTHVASIALGNGGLMQGGVPRFVGMAPNASLIVASPGSSEGFSDPDILNAARFIFDRAEQLGMPAVVNVSLGSDFGGHDGTSALSRGLAAMVGPNFPGRSIVVAAGNSGALYQYGDGGPIGIHTEARVSSYGSTRVPVQIPGYEGVVSGAGFVWITFREGDDIDVALEGPEGKSLIGFVSPGDEDSDKTDDINSVIINNTTGKTASIPSDTNSAVVVWEGSWEASEAFNIVLRGKGDAQLWVTGTRDAGPGLTVGLSFLKGLRFGTIGVPAAHPQLIAVGCTVNRVSWTPVGSNNVLSLASYGGVENPTADSSCYFSSAGPTATGRLKPDLSAPGAFIAAAMASSADPRLVSPSIFEQPGCPDPNRPCHVLDDSHALTSGTSMSAPHVAGAVALLLQAKPSLTQPELLDILQAGARRPSGWVPFDYQLGAGELDLVGSFRALEESVTVAEDVAGSHYVLASPYLRPDPTWLVEGRIVIRSADGMPVAVSRPPRVVVAGGRLHEPPQRIRAGLWRFELSADAGVGGTSATVDVRVGNRSLGQRTIPIGVDGWAAGTGVRAVGGCRMARVGPTRSPIAPWLALAGLAFAWRRRGARSRCGFRPKPARSRLERSVREAE